MTTVSIPVPLRIGMSHKFSFGKKGIGVYWVRDDEMGLVGVNMKFGRGKNVLRRGARRGHYRL